MISVLLLASFLFLFEACTEQAPALNSANNGVDLSKARVTRPLKGTLQAVPGVGPTGPCMLNGLQGFQVEGAGVGEATHLGKYNMVSDICFRPYIPPFGGPGGPVPGEFEGTNIFIAANGDQLFKDVSFQSFPDPNDPTLSDVFGKYEITGGTGRFEGASGSGTMTLKADADPFNPRFLPFGTFEGTITY